MNNVDSIISSHNKRLLNPITNEPGCNCRIKENCPLNNRCLITNIVYEAKVSNNTNTETKTYIGLTENRFKQRYSNHKKDLTYEKYEKSTKYKRENAHNFFALMG